LRADAFYAGSARLPLGLLSHADQFRHWQSSRPDARVSSGWFGHLADALQPGRSASQIPMNISLSGSNLVQNGVYSSHYSITDKGSVGLEVNTVRNALNDQLLQSFESQLGQQYPGDPFKQTYTAQLREAQAQHEVFRRATSRVKMSQPFSDSPLSQQLRQVAISIAAAEALNLPQQTFFVRYIGWDHHDELLNKHSEMLTVLSRALAEFQHALEALGQAGNTVTFTGSDFGRTLTSNGNGTDHGWGGNMIVMGQPVNGGQIYGEYPSLSLANNPLNVGDGVLIPTLSTDQVYAPLARWFGVAQSSLSTLFPNLANVEHRDALRTLLRS
ncbi:MAG: DUF1501 domain-containing protein, partial [Pseudomonadales bacterium]